jgi:pSer/pThr/pTyr-binding forkhead associated (FHA) protein
MIKFYVMDGVDEIQSFDLPGDTVYVGRSSENQIKMKDGYVSGSHLKIIEKGDRYFVQDMGSTNGTFVNGHPIPPGVEVEVEEGVPITMGMSLICLGKACLDHVMPFVDAIFESENLNEVVERYQKRDRPMTERNTMELVYNVSTVLKETLTLNEIMEKILDSILNLLQRMDRGLILLRDTKTGNIIHILSKAKRGGEGVAALYSRTMVDRVVREGKAFKIVNVMGEDAERLSESMEIMRIKSALCVPLISRSEVRGVIYLDSFAEPYGFRNEDLSLLTALGSSAAVAIENALLHSGQPFPSVH